jgi:hypothetical protein
MKSVLSSLFIFFKLPRFVTDIIKQIQRKFLWGGQREGREGRGIAWVGYVIKFVYQKKSRVGIEGFGIV